MPKKNLKFEIQQLSLCPPDPKRARKLLTDMGAGPWAKDRVKADGEVFGDPAVNVSESSVEYALFTGEELEILCYREGANWMDLRPGADPHRVSCIGMTCLEEDLAAWRTFFKRRQIGVAQETQSRSHTHPTNKGRVSFHDVIFDTHGILGVDVKFIVRKEADLVSE